MDVYMQDETIKSSFKLFAWNILIQLISLLVSEIFPNWNLKFSYVNVCLRKHSVLCKCLSMIKVYLFFKKQNYIKSSYTGFQEWWKKNSFYSFLNTYAGSILGLGRCPRCPGGRHGNPLQHSCLENPVDREAWRAI